MSYRIRETRKLFSFNFFPFWFSVWWTLSVALGLSIQFDYYYRVPAYGLHPNPSVLEQPKPIHITQQPNRNKNKIYTFLVDLFSVNRNARRFVCVRLACNAPKTIFLYIYIQYLSPSVRVWVWFPIRRVYIKCNHTLTKVFHFYCRVYRRRRRHRRRRRASPKSQKHRFEREWHASYI